MGTIEVAKQLISAVVGGMTTYNQVIDKVLMRLDREEHDLSCMLSVIYAFDSVH